MKKLHVIIIAVLLYGISFAQQSLDTLSVSSGASLSRAFYTYNINVFTIDAPAALDTAVITLKTSNETGASTFKDYCDIYGNVVEIKLVAGKTTYLDPSIFFGLKTYIKIQQGTYLIPKTAAADRIYHVGLGRY